MRDTDSELHGEDMNIQAIVEQSLRLARKPLIGTRYEEIPPNQLTVLTVPFEKRDLQSLLESRSKPGVLVFRSHSDGEQSTGSPVVVDWIYLDPSQYKYGTYDVSTKGKERVENLENVILFGRKTQPDFAEVSGKHMAYWQGRDISPSNTVNVRLSDRGDMAKIQLSLFPQPNGGVRVYNMNGRSVKIGMNLPPETQNYFGNSLFPQNPVVSAK